MDYSEGWYAAMDEMMLWLNSLDSQYMTAKEVRSAMYAHARDSLPNI